MSNGGHNAVDGDGVEDAEQGDLGDPGPQRPGVLAARCGDTFFSGLAIDG